jgi:hypothetical protein
MTELIGYGRLLLFILILSITPFQSYAIEKNVWYVDTSSTTGPMALVHIGKIKSKKISFAVIYEYERRCDPIFSMFSINANNADLGFNIFQIAVAPKNFLLIIDGHRYTWHSAHAQYENGTELSIAITNEAFNLLAQNPRSLTFSFLSKDAYIIPTKNFSRSLIDAFKICKKNFRN